LFFNFLVACANLYETDVDYYNTKTTLLKQTLRIVFIEPVNKTYVSQNLV